MMSRIVWALCALGLAGCGPAGVGFGLNELFGSSSGQATVEIAELIAPPEFSNDPDPIIQVTGVRLNSVFEARLDNRIFVPIREGDVGVTVTESNATFPASLLNNGDPLDDGEHIIEVRAREGGDRSLTLTARWTIDSVAPDEGPVITSMTATTPREIHVAWNPGSTSDAGTTIRHVVTWELDRTDAPTAVRATTLGDPEPVSQELPITVTTFVIPELEAAVRYTVTVRAVDLADNPATEAEGTRTLRTRTGGTGALGGAITYDIAAPACSVRVGDIDVDGVPDVVAAIGGDGTRSLAVLLRGPAAEVAPDGFVPATRLPNLFRLQPPVPLSHDPVGLALGDIDANQLPDIVAFGTADGGVVLRALGDGSGGFSVATPITGVGAVSSICLGPIDDLATPDLGLTIEPRVPGDPIPLPSRVALLPGDADTPGAFEADFVQGGGTGFFDYDSACRRTNQVGVFTGAGARALITADLDGRGFPDLAFCDLNTVRVARGAFRCQAPSGPTLTRFGAPQPYVTGPSPIALVAADLDGDDLLDIAVSHAGGGVAVLWSREDDMFDTGPLLPTGSSGGEIGIGDFNTDGLPDLVVTDPENGRVWLVSNLGDRRFGTARAFNAGGRPTSLGVGDFNADTIPDVAVNDKMNPCVKVLFGTGARFTGRGTFEFERDVDVTHTRDLLDVVPVDFDADGAMDVLAISHGDVDGVPFDLLTAVRGPLAALDQAVSPSTAIFPFFDTGLEAHTLAVGDLTRDGVIDAIAAGPGGIRLLQGRAGGGGRTFEPWPEAFAAGADDYGGLIVADLDNDGVRDLAWIEYRGDLALLYGKLVHVMGVPEQVSFGPNVVLDEISAVGAEKRFDLASGDFNNDGVTDIAVILDTEGDPDPDDLFRLYLGARNGFSFQLAEGGPAIEDKTLFPDSAGDPQSLVRGDFNGDGRLDLAWLNREIDVVQVLLRQPAGDGGTTITPGPGVDGTCFAVHGGTRAVLALKQGVDPGTCECPSEPVFEYGPGGREETIDEALLVYQNGTCGAPPGHEFDFDGALVRCPQEPFFEAVVDANGNTVIDSTSDGVVQLVLDPGVGCELPPPYERASDGRAVLCPLAPVFVRDEMDNLVETAEMVRLVLDDTDQCVCPENEFFTEINGVCVRIMSEFLPTGVRDDPPPPLFEGHQVFLGALQQNARTVARRLTVGDFDTDGLMDIAVITPNTGEILLLRGRADGPPIPNPQVGAPVAVPALTALASADFNGDGLLDLVIGREGGGLRLILGQGRLSEDPR